MRAHNWNSGQVIALVCIVLSTYLSMDIFLYSRNDHEMKLLALGAAISQIASVMATASTLLVGKVFDGVGAAGNRLPNPADLPPGVKATSSDSVQAPPVDGAA